MHNSMLFLSLMLDNLNLSSVLNSPSGHRINRRSVWKKTILKTEKIRVLPLTVHACKGAYVRRFDHAYACCGSEKP